MKTKKVFVLLLCAAFTLMSCSDATEKRVEAMEEMFEKNVVDNSGKSWQQLLSEKTPIDRAELEQLFPEKLGDFTRVSLKEDSGTPGAIAEYTQDGTLDNDKPLIRLTIIDGAGGAFSHINEINSLLESGISHKDEREWARIEDHNNTKMIFNDAKAKNDRRTSGISFLEGRRYHISLYGNHMTTDDLKGAATEVQRIDFPGTVTVD